MDASTYVVNSRAKFTAFLQAWDDLKTDSDLYTSLGGQSFVATYLDTAGIDITAIDFANGIAGALAVTSAMETGNYDDTMNKMRTS